MAAALIGYLLLEKPDRQPVRVLAPGPVETSKWQDEDVTSPTEVGTEQSSRMTLELDSAPDPASTAAASRTSGADSGLENLAELISQFSDRTSMQARILLEQGVTPLEKILDDLASGELTSAEMAGLEAQDALFERAVGDALLQRAQTQLSMAVDVINKGQAWEYELGASMQEVQARLEPVLDAYAGPKSDRLTMTCGGSRAGTGRLLQFFRADHPAYFAVETGVSDARENRRRGIADYLQSIGKLKGR